VDIFFHEPCLNLGLSLIDIHGDVRAKTDQFKLVLEIFKKFELNIFIQGKKLDTLRELKRIVDKEGAINGKKIYILRDDICEDQ